jgi:hypothetical protein
MITPESVKLQLMALLPRFTDEYSTTVNGSAVVDTGVVVVTSIAHGLTSGDIIVASDVEVIVPVSSVVFDDDAEQATMTTAFEHDRTSGEGDKGGANIASLQDFADANYNEDFDIISATRTTFVVSVGADVVGDLGNLIEPRTLFLGFLEVTVLDDDSFSVALQDTHLPDGTEFETFTFVTEQRIFIAADVTRAVTIYGQRRDAKPTLFIVFGAENASKDRNVVNDSIAAANAQNPLQITYIPGVTLKTIACTKSEQSAATQQQKVYAEIKPAIRRAMYGYLFDGSDNESVIFAAVEAGNVPEFWNQDYYVHNFDYQIPYILTRDQGYDNRKHVSFREVVVSSKMFNNEGDLVELTTEPTI